MSRATVSGVNKTRLSLGIVLVLAGAVWALQGLDVGFVPESVMTGDTTWVVLGALGVVIGLGLIWWSRKRMGQKTWVTRTGSGGDTG
jgi:LPXTG-motif cell wall-anchored protein